MSDGGELEALETYVSAMMQQLDEGGRQRMARKIGSALRRSHIRTIAAQQDPDGQAFAPRKERGRGRRGALRRRASARMFRKLAPMIQVDASPEEVVLRFAGAAARIAAVHHHGLRDRVSRRAGSPEASYPSRRLLGFNDERRGLVMDVALEQLGGR